MFFSQMFLRHARMRSRQRLMQVVPSLALRLMMRLLFAGEQAACVKMQNLRHRYFSVLLGCVPGENCPPHYTWWCASSLLASGRPVWKCPDRVFSLPYSRWAAINTLQVIANNKSYTSCHFSCFSKDNMVVMKTIPINFANSPNVEVTTKFTAQMTPFCEIGRC